MGRILSAIKSAKTDKEIRNDEIHIFLRTSIIVLDIKNQKICNIAYSLLAKSFTIWKIQSVNLEEGGRRPFCGFLREVECQGPHKHPEHDSASPVYNLREHNPFL